MADCTNTAEFLAEWARMHDAQQRDEHGFPKETCTDDNCIGCPLDIGLDCKEFAFRNINHAITKVQKWSDEHPQPRPKTYADDFFEKFPNARGYSFDYDGTKVPSELMRCMLYNIGYACEFEGSKFCDADRRADCWREPYPEQEASE